MTPEQYRDISLLRSRKEEFVIPVEQGRLLLCAVGLAGEAGEVADHIKKHVWHGKPLDVDHLVKECGDVFWYLDRLLMLLGVSLEECMQRNVDKLVERYPEGFKKIDA
jgi:NTP pyrophosphatase (non-canonical NTP hydrolase)